MSDKFLASAEESASVSLCAVCVFKHLGGATCAAFSNGIPDRFLNGNDQHIESVEGDGGVVFKRVEGM